jgi:hypothetical protein
MAIIKGTKKGRVEIDLQGPQGNAFYLLSTATQYAKQLGYSEKLTRELINEMQSSDYANLIEVFDRHFGDFVDLIK